MTAAREQMALLMRDMLAIQTAVELKIVALPSDSVMAPIRRDAASTAERLLDEFESTLLINRVRSIIIRDVRQELKARSKLGTFFQYAAGASTVVLALLIGGAAFLFTDPVNAAALKWTYWICVAVTVTVACAYFYLGATE